MADNTNIKTIPYESIKDKINLTEDKIKQINSKFSNGSLSINEFVKTAELQGVEAKVSIPPNGNLSITEININNKKIYPEQQQGGRKSTRRYGGRKSSRRGGGRKSRRRHNYI